MKKCVILSLLLCALLAGCGKMGTEQAAVMPMEEAEVLMTVDGREIPAWRYLCWLRYAAQRVQDRYTAAEQALDWNLPVEGGTLAEQVKGQALADTVLYATVENWAEQYGCGAPEEAWEAVPLPLPGLTEAQERELQMVGQQYAALYDLYCTEGSALAPSGEELAAFSEESGILILDRILIAAGEDREAARKRAAEVFSRLNGAETPAEAFSALAAEGDDPAGPRRSEETGWGAELLEAARSLEVGQCSGILESDEGFSILMRVAPEAEELREAHFDSLLQQAAEHAEVVLQPRYQELHPADVLGEMAEKAAQ